MQSLQSTPSLQPLATTEAPFDARATFEVALPAQRLRLARLCAHLAGSAADADDLAQETLLEAWRSIERLRDAAGLDPWLAAIARHVCLRWARRRGRDAALAGSRDGIPTIPLEERVADDADPFADMERAELVLLLDRALALLPPATRQALVETYIHERSQAEVAARLALSEGALRVRLTRGRSALRDALTGELREDALALGLALPAAPEWRQSRIWCPFCGRNTLTYRIGRATGSLAFRCSGQCISPGGWVMSSDRFETLLHTLTSPKAILSSSLLKLDAHYREGLARGYATCSLCNNGTPLMLQVSEGGGLGYESWVGFYARCPRCGGLDSATLWHLLLDTPETQRFWRAHPRIRALPEREIEANGQRALVSGFESVGDAARLEFVSTRETLAILAIHHS